MTAKKKFCEDYGKIPEVKKVRKDCHGKPEADRFTVLLIDILRLKQGLPFVDIY